MIYLVRHGLDDERQVGGWSAGGLIEEGIKQANEISQYIKDHLQVKKIYSSDIKRAVETAEIISKIVNLEVELSSDFREQNKGILNGYPVDKAIVEFQELYNSPTIHTKYPQGESMYEFYIRIKSIFEKISELDDCLIVTHRGVINMIYFLINNKLPDMNKTQFNVTHGSIHEFDPIKKKITRIN